MNTHPIIIIGAGPAGLMAAQQLAEAGKTVHIYEQNKAAARKFLVAGHGGFNLTHNEPIEDFKLKYDRPEIQAIVQQFDNQQTVIWLKSIGIETYVGSSGKIFPIKSIKPIQVLQAWLQRLEELGVTIYYEHRFIDFDKQKVKIQHKTEVLEKDYDKLILALGGGSWQKTGSDAKWIPLLLCKEIAISPMEPANSGYETAIDFSEMEGQVIKNIEVSFNDIYKKGELVFTKYGIEGSPIYYLNRFTRSYEFPLTIYVDLKPNLTEAFILASLQNGNKTTNTLKQKLKLSKTALTLLRKLDKETFTNPTLLAKAIKAYRIDVTNFRPIDEVISTAGGITMEALTDSLALCKFPKVYCIGEMVDWEAPTGGYLLQACFSMGHYVANQVIKSE